MPIRIALVGDYKPEVTAHQAIPRALDLAGARLGVEVRPTWIATETLEVELEHRLGGFDAVWCVPATPYTSAAGALAAIRFAREQRRPFLGTCGGFQHALIEYARNVLHEERADHAESNPAAAMPVIAPLACALVEKTGRIRLLVGTLARSLYAEAETVEGYHCSYGFNPRYRSLFAGGPFCITGVDSEGDPRVMELRGHPFYMTTLFQPERSAFRGVAHPLITAFVRAAAGL
jgi:CTP synthase (UTP-ammonia lyase)